MRMRFAQEADSASRFCHPNVVSVLDFGRTENGILYLAMDYVDGETLATLIRRNGPLDETRVVALTRQLARGLGHAHRMGLVHRDFKPANVAIAVGDDGGEQAHVLDFGLAISEREGDRIGRLTEHGLVVGTPIYIAPEQAKDQPVDHRADLFALGVVLYEMLTGKTPFEGSGAEIARANVQLVPPKLSKRNPQVEVTPELEAIVFKLLEKRASERYQSAEDLIAALDRFEQASRRPTPEIARATQPVLLLTGRPSRHWRREMTPPARRAVGEGGWTPSRDGEPTMGMAAASPAVQERMRRRGITAVAWVVSAVAAALVASSLAGPPSAVERSATAAVMPAGERAATRHVAAAVSDGARWAASAALAAFEGKMELALSECSSVPNAERIAAESPTANLARSAAKPAAAQKRRARPSLSSRPPHRTLAVRDVLR